MLHSYHFNHISCVDALYIISNIKTLQAMFFFFLNLDKGMKAQRA